MGMVQIDRHIAISAGWVAGPAFGVAMMAAPEYLHLSPSSAALCFWGGIVVFSMTIVVLGILSFHDIEKQKQILWPILMMSFGSILCIGATWYFWPPPAGDKKPTEINSEYAGLSNSQLRNLVISNAKEMLEFEEKYINKQSDIINNYLLESRASQADRLKLNSEMIQKSAINHNEERTNFDNNYLSKSRSLHLELLTRLGLEYPNASNPGIKDISHTVAIMLLNTGFVAGAQPIADLANYLEDLANKLP